MPDLFSNGLEEKTSLKGLFKYLYEHFEGFPDSKIYLLIKENKLTLNDIFKSVAEGDQLCSSNPLFIVRTWQSRAHAQMVSTL